ncbi:MAG: hypothetical protein AAGC47_07545 [Bacteroidota bacterium]
MNPITRKQAAKELDQVNEKITHLIVDLENQFDSKMDGIQDALKESEILQKKLEGKKDE